MNKAGLISAVAEKVGTSRRDTEKVIEAMLDIIAEKLSEDEKVQLVGFGAFYVKERAAHIGRNPKTNVSMVVEATRAPQFKPGKALKEAVGK